MVALVCRLVADGLPFGFSASVAGISPSGLCAWRNADAAFEAAIQKAVALGIEKRLAVVKDCLQSQDEGVRLRSATWWLCHTPEAARYFSESSRLELSGLDGPLAQVAVLVWPHQQKLLNEKALETADHRLTKAASGAD